MISQGFILIHYTQLADGLHIAYWQYKDAMSVLLYFENGVLPATFHHNSTMTYLLKPPECPKEIDFSIPSKHPDLVSILPYYSITGATLMNPELSSFEQIKNRSLQTVA